MADVSNAKIFYIGPTEVDPVTLKKKVIIRVIDSLGKKTTYIVHQNKKYTFDEVHKFELNYYKKGDIIDFYFNKSNGDEFPDIWRIVNHKSKILNE